LPATQADSVHQSIMFICHHANSNILIPNLPVDSAGISEECSSQVSHWRKNVTASGQLADWRVHWCSRSKWTPRLQRPRYDSDLMRKSCVCLSQQYGESRLTPTVYILMYFKLFFYEIRI